MTDQHPSEDLLVGLALDDVDSETSPSRDELLRHLGTCEVCRREYDSIQTALDRTLAAAPHVDPPPGFDSAVVDAIATESAARSHGRRLSGAQALWLAAAVVLGIALGAGGVVALDALRAQETPGIAVTGNSAVLRDGDGEAVGIVSASAVDGEPVMVVGVSGAPVGKPYTCRLLLADGSRVDAGRWQARTERGWTWVVRVPGTDAQVVRVDLVTDSGAVWSSATLR